MISAHQPARSSNRAPQDPSRTGTPGHACAQGADRQAARGYLHCDDACSAGHRDLFGVRQLKLAASRRIHQSPRLLHPQWGEGYVALTVSSGLQANSSFNITLWASDGTTTQTETVPVVIQAPCKHHY